jgi:two-component system CheB/CheR fusion protein
VDAGKIGVWDWDIPGDRFTWSERTYEFHGLVPGAFGGRLEDFKSLIHPEDAERVAAAVRRAIEDGTPYTAEFRIVRPGGEVRWIASNGRVRYDRAGKPMRMLGATLDTTERKAAEEALREADRRKDEFLAMLAHELRNPLAPIRNALHLLTQTSAEATAGTWAKEVMARQVQHLARLVDDLLDVSRITRGMVQLRKERVDLGVVVARALEAARPSIDDQRHQLSIALPSARVVLEADPTRLEQVLTNLLNNAAKYTDPGGHIWVEAAQEPGGVVVRVRDTGIGMAADLVPRVFDLFSQADCTLARSRGGLGIGLTLARRLVELHGGSIAAYSAGPGRGSEFVVRLPAGAEATPPATPLTPKTAEPSRPATSGRRVLAVDDNVDAARSLAMLLRSWGHEVRVAHDGPEALKMASAFRPEVVLLDIGLPGMDGYEVAGRLRREVGLARALLVAVTGYGQEEYRRRSFAEGFDRYLVKPVDPHTLRELLAGPPVAG